MKQGGDNRGSDRPEPPALPSLSAVSPLDGRYATHTARLRPLVSELGLIRYRIKVELRWLECLAGHPQVEEVPVLDQATRQWLRELPERIDEAQARRVKVLEQRTRHDVKAVEYFIREQLEQDEQPRQLREFIHFGCTSEDINNLAYGLMLQDLRRLLLELAATELLGRLRRLARRHARSAMLSRTHGQPASPTTMGKELANFGQRLEEACHCLAEIPVRGKFNGAVGNYNAHLIAYPEVDWPALGRSLVEGLGLEWSAMSTQIEAHDHLARFCNALQRINSILLDLCRDLWGYIALGYFRQRVAAGEVGSSTMPHKVNPIDFENAEGNLGLANALLGHLAAKLPVSRWQRDLSDSTVLRNLGAAAGHVMIAWQSIARGLDRLEVDEKMMGEELDRHWEVLAEAVQTLMRRHGMADAYDQVHARTHGRQLDRDSYLAMVQELPIPEASRRRLAELSPASYLGNAVEQALDFAGAARAGEESAATDKPEP